jgi:hypothetical protein
VGGDVSMEVSDAEEEGSQTDADHAFPVAREDMELHSEGATPSAQTGWNAPTVQRQHSPGIGRDEVIPRLLAIGGSPMETCGMSMQPRS